MSTTNLTILSSVPASRAPEFAKIALRISNEIGERISPLQPVPDKPGTYRMDLSEGRALEASIDEKSIEFAIIAPDGTHVAKIRDETIALDPDTFREISVDEIFAMQISERWCSIVADCRPIDIKTDKLAHMAAFTGKERDSIMATYRYFYRKVAKGVDGLELDLHLTLPTEYWTGNIAGSNAAGDVYEYGDDPEFSQLLETLPVACEIIVPEGEPDQFEIVPLYLTPIRFAVHDWKGIPSGVNGEN